MAQPDRPLTIWIIQIGEPLPMDDSDARLFRCGLLAQHAHARGHNVRWWTSGFDHYKKNFRFATDETIEFRPGYEIECLRGHGYAKNVSLDRYRDHKQLGEKFKNLAPKRPRPDVIWCCVPIVELALPAVQLARELNIPIVLDAMDRWPDHFLSVLPPLLSPLVKLALGKQWRDTRAAFRHATAISGNSEGFVQWGLKYAQRPRNEWDRPFYFGYPEPQLTSEARAEAERYWSELGVTPDQTNLCFVGTVSNRPFDLATVVQAVKNTKFDGKFVVCGEGESRHELQALAGSDPRIVFAGWRNAAEIAVLMERSQIGIAPYRPTENFLHNIPNKIPEYLAGGLAVLSGVGGEIGQILESSGAGEVYPASDPVALQRALERLLAAPSDRALDGALTNPSPPQPTSHPEGARGENAAGGEGQATSNAGETRLATMRQCARATFHANFRASTIYPAILDHLEKMVAERITKS